MHRIASDRVSRMLPLVCGVAAALLALVFVNVSTSPVDAQIQRSTVHTEDGVIVGLVRWVAPDGTTRAGEIVLPDAYADATSVPIRVADDEAEAVTGRFHWPSMQVAAFAAGVGALVGLVVSLAREGPAVSRM